MVKEPNSVEKVAKSEEERIEQLSKEMFLASAKIARTVANAPPVTIMNNGEGGSGKPLEQRAWRT